MILGSFKFFPPKFFVIKYTKSYYKNKLKTEKINDRKK